MGVETEGVGQCAQGSKAWQQVMAPTQPHTGQALHSQPQAAAARDSLALAAPAAAPQLLLVVSRGASYQGGGAPCPKVLLWAGRGREGRG